METSKERPILFNALMARAILEGRKTQTRRVVKPQPEGRADYADLYNHGPEWAFWLNDNRMSEPRTWKCPYGLPGDRLWVRETWIKEESTTLCPNKNPGTIHYRADGGIPPATPTEHGFKTGRWRPSIHMPRWASRITLEVVDVRVERLQNISEEDARVEGLSEVSKDGTLYKWGITDRDGLPGNDDFGWHWAEFEKDPRDAFRKLWDSINAKTHPWASNPWVWVVEFRVVAPS